jgi:predicted transcriptional regulator
MNLPPALLQKSILQLQLSNWLDYLKVEGSKFKYYVTTKKGAVFLENYGKIQEFIIPENKPRQLAAVIQD